MNERLTDSFQKTGMEFQAEYVTNVRNWTDSLQKYSTLSGAYRKRKLGDMGEIPHSFTFCRRDCATVPWCQMFALFEACRSTCSAKQATGFRHASGMRPRMMCSS